MQRVGNGIPENAVCLTVKCLQGAGTHVDRYFSGHKQILVKDKLDFLILLISALDKTGAGMKLQTAAATDSQLSIDAAPGRTGFVDFFISQRA